MAINKSNTAKQDKDLWATAWWAFFFAEYFFNLHFDIDVSASAHNTKVKDNYITEEQNMLECEWNGETCWLNPPYSNPLPFVERAIEQAQGGKKVVMLLNVDNSTQWFDLCVKNATWIVFVTKGRLPFIHNQTGKETKGNSKPQMFVFFGKKVNNEPITDYIPLDKIKALGEKRMQEIGFYENLSTL